MGRKGSFASSVEKMIVSSLDEDFLRIGKWEALYISAVLILEMCVLTGVILLVYMLAV